jgi:DNA-binding LacI/PurR family transcriptional regulator
MTDERANTNRLMEYLVGLGHRRIGYMNHSKTPMLHYSDRDREAGYVKFCQKNDLPVIDGHAQHAKPSADTFDLLTRQKITALITYDDSVAREALYHAWRRGLQVPRDLSIVTFNDARELNFTTPPLTTLAIPAEKMGTEAARIIMAKVADPDYARGKTVKFAGELVERESAAPRAGN